MSSEPKVTDPKTIAEALERRVNRRTRVKGEISFPAAPALLPLYIKRLAVMFAAIGKKFSTEELKSLHEMMRPRVESSWAISPHGRLFVSWESEKAPASGVDYLVWHEIGTTEQQYAWWVENRDEPLFGKYADARLMSVTEEYLNPAAEHRILDIGAGTGRNTMPLARRGHPVDALELTPEFAKLLSDRSDAENLPVSVIVGDVLGEQVAVEPRKYSLVLCTEVTSHFRNAQQMRLLFERVHQWLKPGGLFLMNAFVTVPGYRPDAIARDLSQVFWSALFTPEEMAAASAGLSYVKLTDHGMHEFESQHQNPDGWPPTGWFEDWSRGFDTFGLREGLPPMEMRWHLYRKEGV